MVDVQYPQDLKNAPGISANNHKTSLGTVIALIALVVVLIIGALYAWGERISKERASAAAAGVER